jgi:transcriptional regulator with XRE-family HTH domain
MRARGVPSVNAAAKLAGLPFMTLSRWVRGEAEPRPDLLNKLAVALAVPAEELLIGGAPIDTVAALRMDAAELRWVRAALAMDAARLRALLALIDVLRT